MNHSANTHLVDIIEQIREALAPILGHSVYKYSALELAVMAREGIKGARMGAHDARKRIEELEAQLETTTKEFNERLVDRTTGMLDSLAKPRLSAASFRAGWEASMDFASGGTSNLEQALQQHLDPKTTDL